MKQLLSGNMRVMSMVTQLGSGGKIIRTREEVMSDHYAVRNPHIEDKVNQRSGSRASTKTAPHPFPSMETRTLKVIPGSY